MSAGSETKRWRGAGLFLLVLGIFLLGASRERPWSDGELMFQVAEALVERHGVEILWASPPYSFRGPDGGIYGYFPLLPSLALVPSVALLEFLGPRWRLFALPLVTQVPAAVLAALATVSFDRLCTRIGVRPRIALTSALVFALATSLWVYARRPYSETLQVLLVLTYVHALLGLRESARLRSALWLGAVAGMMLNTELALGLGAAGGLLAVLHGKPALRTGRILGSVCAGALPWVGLFMAYNHARWGSPFLTGYEQIWELPRESLWWGVVGLSVSPGKSIFLYSPPLILAALALPSFWREDRRLAVTLAAVVVPPMLAVASLQTWNGGWCWGPRVWLFATPILLLPFARWLDDVVARARSRSRSARLAVAAGLVASGVVVQLLGNAFYWDHHVRTAKMVQMRWLGTPNRHGAILQPVERRTCDPCLEDMYGTVWLPAFQPIVGHAWLLRHRALDSEPQVALEDAPWRRYTTIEIDLASSLRRARIDWWGSLWLDDYPERRGIGIGLTVGFLGMIVGGALLLRRHASRET